MTWIDINDVKIFLWISWTSQDDKLKLIIDWVQSMLENIIWDISSSDKIERIELCNLTPKWELFLSNINPTAIKEINWITYVWTDWVDFIFKNNKVTINNIFQYLTSLHFSSFTIKYTSWYTAIPADIQEIMFVLVWQELNKKEWWLIKSYDLWPRRVELDNTNGEADWLINSINSVLSKYIIFKVY